VGQFSIEIVHLQVYYSPSALIFEPLLHIKYNCTALWSTLLFYSVLYK